MRNLPEEFRGGSFPRLRVCAFTETGPVLVFFLGTAKSPPWKEQGGIYGLAVGRIDLQVEVWPGATAGVATQSNLLAVGDLLTHKTLWQRQVEVGPSVAVLAFDMYSVSIDFSAWAICAVDAGHAPGCAGTDGCPHREWDVDPVVEFSRSLHRVNAPAIGRGDQNRSGLQRTQFLPTKRHRSPPDGSSAAGHRGRPRPSAGSRQRPSQAIH